MATNPTFMPVDYTGTSPSNRIHNEQHILNSGDPRDHRIVVPKFSPFYNNQGDSDNKLKVVFHNPLTSTSKVLVEGVDYYCTHFFIDASKATARPIYGSIEILDDTLEGIIKFEYYQALGGQWTITPEDLVALLASLKYNPRHTSWESVVNPPERFPVVDHEWDLVDMVGMKQVVDEIINIRDIILSGSEAGVSRHVSDKDNPHEVTKRQVGLSDVVNYGIATESEAKLAQAKNKYMTPYLVRLAIIEIAIDALNSHKADSNPHNITPALIGAASLTQLATKLDINGTAANSYNFAGYDFDEAKAEILKGTATNATMIGGKTIDELKGEVLSDKVDNADKLNGKTLEEILEMIPEVIEEGDVVVALAKNAELLNNVSLATIYERMDTIKAEIIAGTVNNANHLDGMDLYTVLQTSEDRATELIEDFYANLRKPSYNVVESVTRSRYTFGEEEYYDIYRLDFDDLPSDRLYDSFHSGLVFNFILNYFDFPGQTSQTLLLSVPVSVDQERSDIHKLTLGEATVTPMEPTDLVPKIYVAKEDNSVLRIITSRIGTSRNFGYEFHTSAVNVVNLSGFYEGVLDIDAFRDLASDTLPTTDIIEVDDVYPFSRNLTIEGTIAAGAWENIVGVTTDDNWVALVRPVGTDNFYSWETMLSIQVNQWNMTITNEDDEALEYRIIVK